MQQWSATRRPRACGSARGRPTARKTRRTSSSWRCRPAMPRNLPERNDAADTACIFCTSGTTARPKIVIYNHAAYWMNGLDTLEFLGLTEDDRTLEYRSFGWNSAQVVSLLPFLQKGLTMHIAKRFSHSRFFEWVQKYGITFSAGVPTVLNMLLNKPIGYTAKDVPTLRLMSCSTAPLDRAAMAAVRGDVRRHAVADVRHVGDRLGLRQPALREEDGHRRPAGAASGADDRRRRGQRMPAGRRRRDHRGRAADGDRLPARRRLDRSGAGQAHQDRRPRHQGCRGLRPRHPGAART